MRRITWLWLLPTGVVTLQIPARRIPRGARVLRKERAGAGLAGCAQVVVFGLVAFEIRREKLIDGNRGHSRAANAAHLKDPEVEGVKDDRGNDYIFGGLREDSHASLDDDSLDAGLS